MTTLYENTKDLHHACEQHVIGQQMVNGAITPQSWADWLWAMRCIHQVVDLALPSHMDRTLAFCADLAVLPPANPSRAALCYADSLVGRQDMPGAAYVLHGAHCSGGRVLAPRMAKRGLPTAHTSYLQPDDVRAWLGSVRTNTLYSAQARAAFHCLLAVMDEIARRTTPQ
jgi:hypothetical protein